MFQTCVRLELRKRREPTIEEQRSELDEHEGALEVFHVVLGLARQEIVEGTRKLHHIDVDGHRFGSREHDFHQALDGAVLVRVEHPQPLDGRCTPPKREHPHPARA